MHSWRKKAIQRTSSDARARFFYHRLDFDSPIGFLLQLDVQLAPDQRGGTLQGREGYVALGFQHPVELRPAGVHPRRQLGLAEALPFHLLGELPRYSP